MVIMFLFPKNFIPKELDKKYMNNAVFSQGSDYF